ncbi:MAG: hypothetical protein GC205_07945 [Bacteroidetes bacterium]|nr:hypothetical protein [Bacteroidota bacterium]
MVRLVCLLSGMLLLASAQGNTHASANQAKAAGPVSGAAASLNRPQAPANTPLLVANGPETEDNNRGLLAAVSKAAEVRLSQEYVRFAERQSLPDRDVFILAMTGFEQLQRQGKLLNERYLTVVDFRLPSTRERMWVLDMVERKVVFKTLVAHGVNSGELYATEFSDRPQSFQSSPGFYLASESYIGKHGLSLRLDGLEPGINGNARDRAIVLHGADYVSQEFIRDNGRLGRSQGCPSVPVELSQPIIETIQGQSCFFILQPGQQYLQKSQLVRQSMLEG